MAVDANVSHKYSQMDSVSFVYRTMDLRVDFQRDSPFASSVSGAELPGPCQLLRSYPAAAATVPAVQGIPPSRMTRRSWPLKTPLRPRASVVHRGIPCLERECLQVLLAQMRQRRVHRAYRQQNTIELPQRARAFRNNVVASQSAVLEKWTSACGSGTSPLQANAANSRRRPLPHRLRQLFASPWLVKYKNGAVFAVLFAHEQQWDEWRQRQQPRRQLQRFEIETRR